jgi:signal peptidase II
MLEIIVCIILIAIDQLTKLLAVAKLKPVGSVNIINNFFRFTYVENRGAAFGMLEGGKWLFLLITAVVIVLAAVYYVKTPKTKGNLLIRVSALMIASGAVGNAADRLFRSYVVDFFDFVIFGYDFPVFNFADILIVVGTVIFAGSILLTDDKKQESKDE